MTKEEAKKLLDTYGKAWETQDPELILTVFTTDASYDDPTEPKNFGHTGIRNYWVSKVVEGQKDIHFKLLNIWIDGETVIAEWDADFIDTKRNLKIEMRTVTIFTVQGSKFSSLRECWNSIKTPL